MLSQRYRPRRTGAALARRALLLAHKRKRKLRRGGRPAKGGARTKSGQLSRAASAVADLGTRELQLKRRLLVNGCPIMEHAGSALTVLLAHGHLELEHVRAANRYAAARAVLFGMARPAVAYDQVEPHDPRSRSSGHLMRIRERFESMVGQLGPDQKSALDLVVIDDVLPIWFRRLRTGLPPLPADQRDHEHLLGALDALVAEAEQAPRRPLRPRAREEAAPVGPDPI